MMIVNLALSQNFYHRFELTMEHKLKAACKQISYLMMFSYSFPLTCTGLAQERVEY